MWKYVILSMVLSCAGCSGLRQHENPTITVSQFKMTDNALDITFQVHNRLTSPIWVCEDVSIYIGADEISELKGTELHIKRQMSAYPDTVVFNEPQIGKYVCLKAGATKEYCVNVLLFERFMTFYGFARCDEFEEPISFSQVSAVDFSVGYLDANLCREYLDLAGRNPDDENGINRELPLFVEEYHSNLRDPEILYMPHFWEGIKKEKRLSVRLKRT